jgi:S1-C subfamily serine protease
MFAVVALAILSFSAEPALSDPVDSSRVTGKTTFRIVDIPSNDVLNIREQATPQSRIVGMIPPNGTGIVYAGDQTADGRWFLIRYGNTTGWVASRYLQEDRLPTAAPLRPAHGASTEPPKQQAPELPDEIDGTAFAIDRKGNFLTNYHVVKNCGSIRLRGDGVGRSATLIASDERNDLAVVRTTAPAGEPLRFREGAGIKPGDSIIALGFPYSGLLSSNPQVTTGGVSALSGIRDDIRFLQLTAPVQPGNSGGPLLDLSGNVVGIVSSRINDIAVAQATGSLPQNINFAIKSTIIRTFLDAHQVGYETAQSTTKMEAADVAEAAAKSTFLLVCEMRQ